MEINRNGTDMENRPRLFGTSKSIFSVVAGFFPACQISCYRKAR
jgi:hypothetical protein